MGWLWGRRHTRFEEDDGLQASKLGGVDVQGPEASEDLLQDTQVRAGEAGLTLQGGGELGHREQRAAVQGQGPLDSTQEEQLTPCLLQQNHLGAGKREPGH